MMNHAAHSNLMRSACCFFVLAASCTASIGQGRLPYRIDPPPGSVFFGGSVASGGDVDRDGCDDVLVMDPDYGQDGIVHGRAIMYSGRTGARLWTFVCAGQNDVLLYFRHLVGAFLGDIDRDGCDDVALAQPTFDNWRGRVDILSGRTGSVIFSYEGTVNSQLGRDVAGVGDVDGDTIPDFAFVTSWSPEGGFSVRSGSTGTEIYNITQPWARRITRAGDIDGDQHTDFAVGSWKFTGLGIKVYSGADASVIHDIDTPDPDDALFGWNIAGGYDLNGDQVPDLLASGDDGYGPHPSAHAYMIDGRTGDAQIIAHFRSETVFGITTELADVNGDGKAEAIIGAQLGMWIYDASTEQLLYWSAPPVFGRGGLWGTEMTVGDVNGDGAADFINQDMFGAGGVLIRAGAPILLHPFDYYSTYRTSRPFSLVAYTGQPGRNIYFLASRRGTSCTFIPRLNTCIDLTRPFARVGSATTDAEGNATIEIDAANAQPGPVWLQAIDLGDPSRPAATSNVLQLELRN